MNQRGRRNDVTASRQVAYDVLTAVRERDAYANLLLPKTIRKAGLRGPDAALATELTYGTLRAQGTYDAVIQACARRSLDGIDPALLDALRLGVHQLLALRVPDHAAVDQSVALVASAGQGPAGFVNAVLRKVASADLEQWISKVAPQAAHDPVGHLAITASHPEWVVRALREALILSGRPAEEITDLLAADNAPPRVTLTVLPGLATDGDLAGTEPGLWSPFARIIDDGDPGELAAVAAGRARVQDEGSQLAVLALSQATIEGEDHRWLDLCAGPGGKTALLGAVAGPGVQVCAVEISDHRADLVRTAVQGLPQDRVQVVQADGRRFGPEHPDGFDRVLVDAPCTGLGALRRRPEARWRRTPSDLAALTPLQRELLSAGLDAVRPGGVLAYVTCSPHPVETQFVVADVMRSRAEVVALDTPALLQAAVGRRIEGIDGPTVGATGRRGQAAQLWPHLHGTDAMFVCLLQRR